jgi:hypothetical protein
MSSSCPVLAIHLVETFDQDTLTCLCGSVSRTAVLLKDELVTIFIRLGHQPVFQHAQVNDPSDCGHCKEDWSINPLFRNWTEDFHLRQVLHMLYDYMGSFGPRDAHIVLICLSRQVECGFIA